jgi:hypothetical protein
MISNFNAFNIIGIIVTILLNKQYTFDIYDIYNYSIILSVDGEKKQLQFILFCSFNCNRLHKGTTTTMVWTCYAKKKIKGDGPN